VLLVWFAGAGLVGAAIGAAEGGELAPAQLLLAALAPSALACAALFALLARRRSAGGAWRALGFGRPGLARETGRALLRYARVAPFLLLAGVVSVRLYEAILGPPGRPVLDRLAGGSPSLLPVVLAGVVVVGPLLEEILFRGFLQNALAARFGARAAILLASGCWALGHEPVAWLPILLFGLFLGGLYRSVGALGVLVGVHAFHNALTLGLLALMRLWTGS
jgi:membrane protease YdiL (CAAX protease family)